MSKLENFSILPIQKEMLKTLDNMGFGKMTPVQAQTLPFVLEGLDVMAQAKTGSGKTAAFGIGLLSKLNVKNFKVQSLVICPTRELCEQVASELRNIAKFKHNIKILTLCGGVAFGPQLGSLRHGAHIVVGTPGRLLRHLEKESLKLDNIATLVLDEADRMLDMGFIEEMQKVISYIPNKRQTLLFSATFPDEIEDLVKSIQTHPVNIKTISSEPANDVTEYFYKTPKREKFSTLIKILNLYNPQNVILFCNTKIETDEVAKELRTRGIDALAINGDLEQYERVDVLVQFINKSCRILVATDVAARGLDIKELDMVVNYDLPNTFEVYTHRIGRTARAGKKGLAVTLCDEYDIEKLNEYEGKNHIFKDKDGLKECKSFLMSPENMTLVIEGGKKNKIRPGDILGALTKNAKIESFYIGKIDIFERQSYVAIQKDFIKKAYNQLKIGKIKGKNFSVWVLE
ncbi:MAG: ATP-dependent RNA helicase DbpA [Sulfurospirillum sp.]